MNKYIISKKVKKTAGRKVKKPGERKDREMMKEKSETGKGILGVLAELLFLPLLIIAMVLSLPMMLLAYICKKTITMSIGGDQKK